MASKRVIANVTYDNLDPVPSDVSGFVTASLSKGQYQVIGVTTVITGQSPNETTPGTASITLDMVVSPDPGDPATQAYVSAALLALILPTSNNPLTVTNVTVFDTALDPTPGPPQPSPNFPVI